MQLKLVADVFIRASGKTLLVRYAHPEKYDDQTGWFLPDDFLRHGEHPADAAARILREQVGMTDVSPSSTSVRNPSGPMTRAHRPRSRRRAGSHSMRCRRART